MTATNALSRNPRRYAWVLWLALLVPMAQLAAAVHVQSHWSKDAASSLEHKATPADACGQCVAVASIAAGGVVTAAAIATLAPAHFALLSWAVAPVLSADPFAGYRSRAPPAAAH
ncbi:hypothetical protein [Caenimonas aquaedulcis]|uniref:DUF2946 domain-containing protein n=1 Tax=Caenimonas aquaedulcis TaxID=2793270 RepID=A0A931H6C6_9BURK|nr:hypothetical protein [Caenimonas aquaedulcis]MBG9389220.1 hypothetical protein [Caenimonas aquaedulcis]